jgi:hypothetical protein
MPGTRVQFDPRHFFNVSRYKMARRLLSALRRFGVTERVLGVCTYKIAIGDSDLINVRFDPLCGLNSDITQGPRSAISGREQMQQVAPLLDHLIGLHEQRRRDRETRYPGCLEVDHQLILCRQLNR